MPRHLPRNPTQLLRPRERQPHPPLQPAHTVSPPLTRPHPHQGKPVSSLLLAWAPLPPQPDDQGLLATPSTPPYAPPQQPKGALKVAASDSATTWTGQCQG